MEDSFTEQLRHEWEVFSVDIVNPPTTEEILKFLKKRMANLSISAKPSSTSHPSSVSHTKPNSTKPKGHVFKIEEKKNFSCTLCKGELLGFGRCPTFKSWDQQKRYNHIKSINACTNCLHPEHLSRNCQSRYKCRECNLNHHTLLHRDQTRNLPDNRPSSASDNPPSTTTHTVARIQGPQEGAILATALVSVSSEKYVKSTRVLLDPGSTISLMTSSLAKELQSELTPSTMHIEGIAGVTTSNHVATVTLCSAFQEDGDFIHVQCQVVEELPRTPSNHDLSKFYQLPSIKGKQLADPGFGKTTKIEILLGVGACNRASCVEHVKTEEPAISLS